MSELRFDQAGLLPLSDGGGTSYAERFQALPRLVRKKVVRVSKGMRSVRS
jgi:hypothetical protein